MNNLNIHLSVGERLVLDDMVRSYNLSRGEFKISISELATDHRVSVRTAQEWIKKLKDKGLIVSRNAPVQKYFSLTEKGLAEIGLK